MKPCIAYITVGNREEALKIANHLVESKFAACVNIIDGATSIYRWQGEIQADREVILIAKTTLEQFDSLASAVTRMHSYENPCIVQLPIQTGSKEYMSWITTELTQ